MLASAKATFYNLYPLLVAVALVILVACTVFVVRFLRGLWAQERMARIIRHLDDEIN